MAVSLSPALHLQPRRPSPTPTHTAGKERLERPWAVRDEGRADLLDAMGERELQVRREQLLDVRPADVGGLLDLDDAEDLVDMPHISIPLHN